MADDSTTTIRATFETRAAAEIAVEHLVQQHGIGRPDIFIQSITAENTEGTSPSGAMLPMKTVPAAMRRLAEKSKSPPISRHAGSRPFGAA